MIDRASQDDFRVVRLVYNAQAGNRGVTRQLNDVMASLNRLFPRARLEVRPTSGPYDATRLAREVARAEGENGLVIIAGGDGSVSEAANGVMGTDTPLLVLPFGTGNDFARTIYRNQSQDPRAILAACEEAGQGRSALSVHGIDAMATSAKSYRLPDGTTGTNFERFAVNVISIGFDSVIGIEADRLHRKIPWLLGMSYPISVLTQLTRRKAYELTVTWCDAADEEKELTQEYTVCAVANASYYGGGFQPNPRACIDDGIIEVILSHNLKNREIAKLIGKFRRGDDLPKECVEQLRGSQFVFRAERGHELILTLDGQGLYTNELTVDVYPRHFVVARPAGWVRPPALSAKS
ncbi:MAG: diacylglycerol kinase family protein [Actinomycetaceae bacterium]|nr:diacylglycerol kinase family protein [Actinomycetaceae bacterium]